MRRWITVLTFVSVLFALCSISEAKGGKGKKAKKFRSRGGVDTVLGSPVESRGRRDLSDFQGRQDVSQSFPRGNAWGLRSRLNQSVPVRRRGDLSDGDTIFRAGRTWEFDARTDTFIPR